MELCGILEKFSQIKGYFPKDLKNFRAIFAQKARLGCSLNPNYVWRRLIELLRDPNFKKKPCRNYQMTGKCSQPDRCWGLHPGEGMYKKKACSDIVNTGRCPRGRECCYLHDEDVVEGSLLDHLKNDYGYKKKRCAIYEKYGNCRLGRACRYLHPNEPFLQLAPKVSRR